MYIVKFANLDMPREGGNYSERYPHIDREGSTEYRYLDDAIELCEEIRNSSLYYDAKVVGDNVPEEYSNYCQNYSY